MIDYIEAEYAEDGDRREALRVAYEMRALVVLFDGIDEATRACASSSRTL